MHYCRITTVSGLLLALVVGCAPRGKPDPKDQPITPDQITDFDQLFAANCAGCHGASGDLGPAPPLNDHLFVAIISDEELFRVIRDGRPGTPMPAFATEKGGSLTDAQVKALAAGIKSRWKPTMPLGETPPAYALSAAAAGQLAPEAAERGAKIYASACASCHGPNGGGGEHTEQNGGAINAPAFLSLISDQALRRIIITGRPDLGMPNYAEQEGRSADFHSLTSAEIDDLVALLAHWRTNGAVAKTEKQ